MTENKKSLIEQAMADFEAMRSNLVVNTENILRSVAKDEVKSSLKENVNEADYDEEDVDDELENDAESTDMGGEESEDTTTDTEETPDSDDMASLDTETEPTMEPEDSEDYTGSEDSEDYTLDMTGAADDEVISVFKKMGENDGVEVVSDNEINITTPDGSEYQVKLGGDTEEPMGDFDAVEDSEEDEDIMFEIEMDDEDEVIEEDIVRGPGHDKYAGGGKLPSGNIEGQTAPVDSESGDNLDGGFDDKAVKHANAEGPMVMSEEEDYGTNELTGEKLPNPADQMVTEEEAIEEQIPVGMAQDKRVPATNAKNAGIVGAGGDLAKKLAESEAKYKKLLAEAKKLEAENNEFKNAIVTLRKGLGETGLYTRNLTSATKLFLEHTTTREEKHDIMKRFDAVKTIKESKELERIIANELSSRNNLTENVERKITNTPTSSNSRSLQETYVHPSISRSLELMKIKK